MTGTNQRIQIRSDGRGMADQRADSQVSGTGGQGRAQAPFDASRIAAAVQMLELFASVGATVFDLTHTNEADKIRGFRPGQSLAQITNSMRYLIPSGDRRRNNVIVRPRSRAVTLVQLDDLTPENRARIEPAAFLVVQTSARGVQSWVAIKDAPAGFSARLRKGVGCDRAASGAVRIAGSTNYKADYAPDQPIVAVVTARPGHVMTPQQLEALNVVAPAEAPPPPLPPIHTTRSKTSKWPDYARCLKGSEVDGKPKRTKADFAAAMIAQSWGHGIEQTADWLMTVSTKAQENGYNYALQTATNAEYAARQRNARPRGRPPGKGL
jgi:hypothetical protein